MIRIYFLYKIMIVCNNLKNDIASVLLSVVALEQRYTYSQV